MNESQLYWYIKGIIQNVPACPDGGREYACSACIANAVTDSLIQNKTVEVSNG